MARTAEAAELSLDDQRPGAALIQPAVRWITEGFEAETAVRRQRLLSNSIISFSGEPAIAANKVGASLGGLALQLSLLSATTVAGTETALAPALKAVSPDRLCWVTDDVRTTPATLPPRRAAPFTAAVEPWLVPTSQTGTLLRDRAKSTATPIAAA